MMNGQNRTEPYRRSWFARTFVLQAPTKEPEQKSQYLEGREKADRVNMRYFERLEDVDTKYPGFRKDFKYMHTIPENSETFHGRNSFRKDFNLGKKQLGRHWKDEGGLAKVVDEFVAKREQYGLNMSDGSTSFSSNPGIHMGLASRYMVDAARYGDLRSALKLVQFYKSQGLEKRGFVKTRLLRAYENALEKGTTVTEMSRKRVRSYFIWS